MEASRNRYRFGVPAVYALLSVLLSSPRLLSATAYVADDWHDVEIFFWDFWWLGQALRAGTDPWFSTLVFYPQGTSLGFHPTGFLYGTFSLPWQMLLGPEVGIILAYNLITLSSLTLAGWFTYLLARSLHVDRGPAFLGGLVYSYSAFHFWHLGRLHVGGIEWLPLYMLALLRLLRPSCRPWRDGLLTGGAAVLLLYSSLTHFSSAILITVVCLGISAVQDRQLMRSRRMWTAALVTGAVVVLAAIPFLHAWTAYPGPVGGGRSVEENSHYSADLLGYVLPGRNSRLYGGLAPAPQPRQPVRGEETFTGFLPWLLLPLALVGVGGRPRPWRWLILAGFFAILSLGPELKVMGMETGVPLPYRALYEVVPLIQANRTPVRYAAPFLMFLSLLAAMGAGAWIRRNGRRWLLPLLVAVALAESLFHLPLTERQPAPALYGRIAGSQGVVLNVPLYHARLERRLMYHQIFHGRPVTQACIPRASATPHRLIEATGLRSCLLEAAACERVAPAAVRQEIRQRQVEWILVHNRFQEAAHGQAIRRLLLAAGAEPFPDPAGIEAYRFAP